MFVSLLTRDLFALTCEVPGIFRFDLDLFGDRGIVHCRAQHRHRQQLCVIKFGATQQIQRMGFAAEFDAQRRHRLAAQRVVRRCPQCAQSFGFSNESIALACEAFPARVVDQLQCAAGFGQAQIGVVFAQLQPVFGAAGEHAVGLAGAVRDQVVDHHADIGFIATRRPCVERTHETRGVEPGDEALSSGFFIAGGAVDLAGEKQSGHEFCFQRILQSARIEEVVFDRITGAGDVRVLETADAAHQIQLHVERQRCGDTVRINFGDIQAFGFDEYLMRGLLGEAHHFVLDRRAIARADAFDLAAVQRRTVEGAADDVVGALGRVRDPA